MNLSLQKPQQDTAVPREYITGTVTYENATTPSRHQLIEAIAQKTKKPTNTIVIKSINKQYGTNSSLLKIYIYNSLEAIKRFEQNYMVKRNTLPEKPKEEPKQEKSEAKPEQESQGESTEQPAAESKEEKPSEQPTQNTQEK